MPDSQPLRGRTEGSARPFTILLAPASNVLFHVGRCVVVARELASRGHRVVSAGTERYLRDPAVVAASESAYVSLPDFGPEEGMDVLRSILYVPERRRIEELIEAEIAVLRELKPDLVVADFRPTISISARACGIPVVSLLLHHWTREYADDPEWLPRSYALGELLGRTLGDRLGRAIANPVFRRIIRYKTSTLRAASRARGLPAHATLWDYLRGDLNLLTESAALGSASLPADCRRVGPIVWEPDSALPAWVDRLAEDRPVIFVNYGSTGHPDLFRRTLEELGEMPYQVILATCRQVELRPEDIPSNFFVETYVPMQRILERADLVVHHGGAGTFHQVLRAGVPGIVVATHWDQEHTGFISEREGLGEFLTLREALASRGRLRDATARMLEGLEGYRARVGRLRDEILQYDGAKSAAESIELYLHDRGVQ